MEIVGLESRCVVSSQSQASENWRVFIMRSSCISPAATWNQGIIVQSAEHTLLGIVQIGEVERYRTETKIPQVEVIRPDARNYLFLEGRQASAWDPQVDDIVAVRTIANATQEALLVSVQ